MTGRAIVVISALWAVTGCTSAPAARPTAVARSGTTSRLTDSSEFRRLCVVAPDSAVDTRRPCVLRDQSPIFRKPR
jgi:hypothetical protein